MASRTPPNRSRGRVSVPPITRTPRIPGTPGPGLEFERTFLTPRISPAVPGGASSAARARERLEQPAATQIAMEEFYDGDSSLLLPYQPTPSINPPRPRTLAAGYDSETKTLRVQFRNGTDVYEYYDVPPNVWRNFRRVKSPGRMINRVLNSYEYARM